MRILFFFFSAVALTLAGCAVHAPVQEQPQPFAHITPAADFTLAVSATEVISPQPSVSGYLLGTLAQGRADYEMSRQAYVTALAEDSDNIDIQEKLFAMSVAVGDMDTAIRLAKVLKNPITPTLVDMLLGVDYAVKGDTALAQEKLARLEKTAPAFLPFQLMNIYVAFDAVSKTDTAAREKIVAQLAVSGTQPSLEAMRLYHVGRLYERLDKQGEAQKSYEEAYARDPLAKQLADALVGLYMRTGAAEKAQKIQADYNKLNRELVLGTGPSFEKSDGSTPTLRGDLGQVLVGTGLILLAQDFDLAGRQMLQMARYANPQEPFASFYLGVADERMGRRDRALESYAAVPESSPLWFNAQLRRAEVLATHGHIEQAIDQLELLLKIRPNDAFVHRSLAEIYYHEKKFKQAVEHYNAIFAQVKIPTQEHVMLLFARGSGYERLGEITKATNDLQQALRIDPDNATLLNYLGYMWVDQNKNLEEAFAMISKAVDLSPNDGAIVDSLGWAYYKKNQYDLAVKYLERAVELEPVDATINSHLGDAYFKVGRLREAIVQWQRALKLNPQTDEERRHLERQLRDFAQEQTRR